MDYEPGTAILSFFNYLCHPNFLIKTMLEIQNHIDHDESRQGESYAPFSGDPNRYDKKFYIESYGCQMNFSDSEIVASILNEHGFGATPDYTEADLVLLNTCSI